MRDTSTSATPGPRSTPIGHSLSQHSSRTSISSSTDTGAPHSVQPRHAPFNPTSSGAAAVEVDPKLMAQMEARIRELEATITRVTQAAQTAQAEAAQAAQAAQANDMNIGAVATGDIPRPRRVGNLQDAMGLSHDKATYNACRVHHKISCVLIRPGT
ncbi:hypothetical protein CVT24_002911 [Panaeolus cyanescens]|uniref:Uncharacterized protein n=1 Tax=Panaeolus cyanescens TaxID=181874 RepID=A0A409YRQ8_9AGAR|nr:hypothetical protein CVT24_002911 [Panaeolus cyanescens]